jgi:hypothetical protein
MLNAGKYHRISKEVGDLALGFGVGLRLQLWIGNPLGSARRSL